MALNNILSTYRRSINECRLNMNIAFQIDASGNYIHAEPQRDFIVESVFLKIFIAWENFLESVFIEYLLGEVSTEGRSVIRYATPIDREHAVKIIIGTQKYVDWANPEIVRRLSKLYFNSINPIDSVISSIQTDIFDLKTIRNSAAHISTTTGRELDSLATRKLRRPCTNVTVSQFILFLDPNIPPPQTQTFLESYLILLDVAAENICRG